MLIKHHFGCVMQSPEAMPITHCVSFCGRLGAGAARSIQDRYQIRDQFRSTPRSCVGLVPIQRGDRLIINLITKLHYRDKPTPKQMFQSLVLLRNFLLSNKISEIACTILGCGKDNFSYQLLLQYFNVIFSQDPITFHFHHM